MADRQPGLSPSARVHRAALPGLTPMVGFLTLLISGGILLVLTGFTLTAAVIGLFFFAPLILLSSPIWVPAVALLFLAAAVVLCASGFGMVVLAAASSLYHYFSGRHPLGSDRLNYPRSQVEDYACEYGGYFQSRIKDAAPGA